MLVKWSPIKFIMSSSLHSIMNEKFIDLFEYNRPVVMLSDLMVILLFKMTSCWMWWLPMTCTIPLSFVRFTPLLNSLHGVVRFDPQDD